MSTSVPVYFFQRVLRLRLSLQGQLLLLAMVAVAYWFTLPSRRVSISVTQAQPAAPPLVDTFGPRICLRETSPPDDDSARHDDSLVLALTPAFEALNLGPGLRKRTSKTGKKVRWAEERNTMRYCTKWIGREDDDPGGEHFTEDVIRTPDGCGRTRRANDAVIEAVQEEEEEEWYQLDCDGDIEMADVDVDMDVVLAISL